MRIASRAASEVEVLDLHPVLDDIRALVLRGLSSAPKQLPSKLFYDARGSALFNEICELEEYYPTRTELQIMADHGAEMATALGADLRLVEFGSGSSHKTRFLLDALEEPSSYVPVDISKQHLIESAAALNRDYPDLVVQPVCADYTQPLELPEEKKPSRRTAAYFKGSTIGNFTREQAIAFLRMVRQLVGDGDLLLGADREKDVAVLEAAYNDRRGVTAMFNKNLLARFNRELGADFDLEAFAHRAFYDTEHGRIVMQLISERAQVAHVGDHAFRFEAGEAILTEYSHKFSRQGIEDLAAAGGFVVEQVWTDPQELFSVQLLRADA